MSGLYNVVFDQNPNAGLIVALLATFDEENALKGKSLDSIRFRDVWIERNGEVLEIHLYTRMGGNNRADYAAEIEALRGHPWFDRDADDEYDATYAGFWFRIDLPAVRQNMLEIIGQEHPDSEVADREKFADHVVRDHVMGFAQEPVDTDARWQKALADLENGGVRPDVLQRLDEHVQVIGPDGVKRPFSSLTEEPK